MARDDNHRLMNDLGQTTKDLQAEKQKLENANTQIERLRSLVENLDTTKDELLAKLQSALTEKRGGDGEKAVLMNDIQSYKRELLSKDQQINDLKQSIAMLDANLDDMQAELD